MTRYHHTGRDHWTPRARSGFTPEYIHGPLLPMERPERQPSLAAGVTLLIGCAMLFCGIAAVMP